MKKLFLIFILVNVLHSCSSQRKVADIIYFLPDSVNELLMKEMERRKHNNVYLVIEQVESDIYTIYMNNISSNSAKFWIKYSNRAVYVKDKIIPLYFYLDEDFSYVGKGRDIINRLNREQSITKVFNNREHSFQIKFKYNGEILQ